LGTGEQSADSSCFSSSRPKSRNVGKAHSTMAQQRRPKLPRGLHWDGRSPFVFFNWRDALGKQRHQSTSKTDPQEALLFKLKFLAEREEKLEETEADAAEDLGRVPIRCRNGFLRPGSCSAPLKDCAFRSRHTYPALHKFEDPVSPRIETLLRRPFPAQTIAIMGTVERWRFARTALIVAECGTGKTLISRTGLSGIHD
jgi:hypothetical protein